MGFWYSSFKLFQNDRIANYANYDQKDIMIILNLYFNEYYIR